MDLNFLVFPAPKCSYSEDTINGQLIWIPKYEEQEQQQPYKRTSIQNDRYSDQNKVEEEFIFSATKNKNFGSHQKPINYKQKRTRQNNQSVSFNTHTFEDPYYNDDSSQRMFHSTSSQRQFKSSLPNQTNMITEQKYKTNIISQNLTKKETKQKTNQKQTIQIGIQGQMKKTLKAEDTNKSCHDLNSCDFNTRDDDCEEERMNKECNEYDEMFSNISCNIKPDSITQYSFSKQNQKSDSSTSSSSTLKQKNDKNKENTALQNTSIHKRSQTFNFNTNRCKTEQVQPAKYLPCLYLNSGNYSPNYLLYFHGNGEDINLAYDLLSHLKNNLEVNVIALEYPGYGVYEEYDASVDKSQLIQQDAVYLYDYLTKVLNIDEKKIIIFGRSIGSGPATYVAAHRNPGALVLMSAFTCLRQVASDLVGKFLSLALKDRFNNLENIKSVTCPTYLVHGQIDKLISFNHSINLFQNCGGICEINLPKQMTHVEFDFYEDFSKPLVEFLQKNKFNLYSYVPRYQFQIPYNLFQNPKNKIKSTTQSQAPNSSRTYNLYEDQRIYLQSSTQ